MQYVFYDTETTGLDTTFDQILQFAAIYTDDDFREIDRFEIRCRLLPHVIPAPGALLATRVTPEMLTDPALRTHHDAMRRISEVLNRWAPTIFIGYNTLAFDEPLLRQAFYQTLQPVYLTNTNGNKRGDVLRLAQATTVLAPNAIAVPLNAKGKPTLKLDMLAPANGFAHENAHDALADVEATIFIARLIRERAPAVWNAVMPMIDKGEVTSRVLAGEPHCLVDYYMGRSSVRPVIGCGQGSENAAMLGVFDLTFDPDQVLGLDVEDLVAAMSGRDRSIRIVYANKMPAVVELDLIPDLNTAFEVPAAAIYQRAQQITRDGDFKQRVGRALAQRFPPSEPSEIIEARIYEGFPSYEDKCRMAAFHDANWLERSKLIETFDDDRLCEMGRRLIFLEEPAALDQSHRERLTQWLRNRQFGQEGVAAGRTVADAMNELDKFDEEAPDRAEPICAIRAWLVDYGYES